MSEQKNERKSPNKPGMGGPRGRMTMPGEKVDHPMKTLGRVLGYMTRGFKPHLALVLLCLIIQTAAQLIGALFLRTLIDDYIAPMIGSADPDFGPLMSMLIKLGAVYVISAIASYFRSILLAKISMGTLLDIREIMFSKLEQRPLKYFDTHSHGDIMSVFTNDVDTLRMLMSQMLTETISALFTVTSTFVSMIVLNVPMTVLSVVMVAVTAAVTIKLGKKSGKFFVQNQKNLGEMNGYIEEMIEGQKVIKVFCHEEKNIEGFKKKNEELRSAANSANKLANIMMPVNNNLSHISYVACALLGGFIAIKGGGALTVGTIVSFLSLNRNFSRPISQLSSQASSVVMAMAGAQRIFEIIDGEPEVDEGRIKLVNIAAGADGSTEESDVRTDEWAWKRTGEDGAPEYIRLNGEVVFDDVNFGYTPDKPVLHNISLYAKPGQKIAFVGSTGAGKTTITNLINRFYDIESGRIFYDGIDIKDIEKQSLRRSLGIVLQDTNLFSGTIMDNIRYGRLSASDEECIEAAKLANADSFIKKLPEGYATHITGNGSNLSQGQRQLISIARAAVMDPPVLILDEATSSIDTHTEHIIQKGMDGLMNGRTTLVIAHRLSTVMNSDCIMVLENGCIIERGNHEELLSKRGKYYQLYTGNFAEG